MSTKATILLSDHNEHWYHDCNDGSITLEIDDEHEIEKDDGCNFVTIKKGTALHAVIMELWGRY